VVEWLKDIGPCNKTSKTSRPQLTCHITMDSASARPLFGSLRENLVLLFHYGVLSMGVTVHQIA